MIYVDVDSAEKLLVVGLVCTIQTRFVDIRWIRASRRLSLPPRGKRGGHQQESGQWQFVHGFPITYLQL